MQKKFHNVLQMWPHLSISLMGICSALLLLYSENFSTKMQLGVISTLILLGAISFVWIIKDRRFHHGSLYWIFSLALLVRVIAIYATPLLEDDYYRYLWDGYRTATEMNPYQFPPSAFFHSSTLSAFWKDILYSINNPTINTIYGPVLQGLFAAAYAISPGNLNSIQWLLLISDICVLGLLANAGVKKKLLLIYAIHPLILKEAMASAHPDALVALFLVIAILSWKNNRAYFLGISLGFAIATKISALVALPLFYFSPLISGKLENIPETHSNNWISLQLLSLNVKRIYQHFSWQWALKISVSLSVTLFALYAPFIVMGSNESELKALSIFSQEWRFNPLVYNIFAWCFAEPIARIASAISIFIGLVLLCCYWQLAQYRLPISGQLRATMPPLDYAFTVLLLFSPVVNPWYWLWALAPSLLLGHRFTAIVAIAAMLSYFNTSVFVDIHEFEYLSLGESFHVILPATILQIVIIISAIFYDIYVKKNADENVNSAFK